MYLSLQQLQKQLLDLPVNERWQLVRVILESLQQDTTKLVSPQKNLSRLRGIARSTSESLVSDQDDYADYLTQKYQ
ncbi:MAG: hypothetical protein RLZZ171_2956 [Cyanobacteriota bacterium]|jgi:hypothetical protein